MFNQFLLIHNCLTILLIKLSANSVDFVFVNEVYIIKVGVKQNYWTLDVSQQQPMKSLSSVCPSVRPSVRLSVCQSVRLSVRH